MCQVKSNLDLTALRGKVMLQKPVQDSHVRRCSVVPQYSTLLSDSCKLLCRVQTCRACNAATQSWDNVQTQQNFLAVLHILTNEDAEVDVSTPWGESDLGDS